MSRDEWQGREVVRMGQSLAGTCSPAGFGSARWRTAAVTAAGEELDAGDACAQGWRGAGHGHAA